MIYLKLFFTFFKIGLFTFGGGYAMLPLIQAEVANHGWLTQEQLINFVAVSESTPGPFAINISTYVGNQMGGILGGVCATLGVVMPSIIIILIVAQIFDRFKNSRIMQGCMAGLKPAVIGLIGSAMLSMVQTVFFTQGVSLSVLKTPAFYVSLALFGVMSVLALKKVHPIIIICISAVVGIAAGYGLGL
ncbi:MAG: chromate transporter [Ruminococcus sp.]|nr:chromate transporter [Ruminococcus sp.]